MKNQWFLIEAIALGLAIVIFLYFSVLRNVINFFLTTGLLKFAALLPNIVLTGNKRIFRRSQLFPYQSHDRRLFLAVYRKDFEKSG